MARAKIIRSSDEEEQQRINRKRTLDIEVERKDEIYCVTVEIPWHTSDENRDYYNSSEIYIEDDESLSISERAAVRAAVKANMERDSIHDEA